MDQEAPITSDRSALERTTDILPHPANLFRSIATRLVFGVQGRGRNGVGGNG